MDNPRVVVLIPSYRAVPAEVFAHTIKALIDCTNKGLIAGVTIETGLYITVARNKLAMDALAGYRAGLCTHVWWIDDDVAVEEDTLEKLLAWEKPVVSGLYYSGPEFLPMAYEIRSSCTDPIKFLGDLPNEGLVRVGGIGFGCLLMEGHILDGMVRKYGSNQLFQTPPNLTELNYSGEVGEDVFFCHRLGELGIPIYLDCGTNCGHVRYFELNRTMVRIVDKGIAKLDEEDE